MSRTRAVMDAAEYGAHFVHRGLLTKSQLDQALKAVSEGLNFEVFILLKEWATEDEIEALKHEITPLPKGANGKADKPKAASMRKVACVSLNRMEAHQEQLFSTLEDFSSFGMSLLEDLAERIEVVAPRQSTQPMWKISPPEEENPLPEGVVRLAEEE